MTNLSLEPCTVVDAEKTNSSYDDISITNKVKECLNKENTKNKAFKELFKMLHDEKVEIHHMINFAVFYVEKIKILNLNQYEFYIIANNNAISEFLDMFFNYIKFEYGVDQQKQSIFYPLHSPNFKTYIFPRIDIEIKNTNIFKIDEITSRLLLNYKNASKKIITVDMENTFKKDLENLIKLYNQFIINRSNYFSKSNNNNHLEKDFFESSMQDLFICFNCLYIDNNSGAMWHLHQHIEKMLKKILMTSTDIRDACGRTLNLKTHDIKVLIRLVETRLNLKPKTLPIISLEDVSYRYQHVERQTFMTKHKKYMEFLSILFLNEELSKCFFYHLTEVQDNQTVLCTTEEYENLHLEVSTKKSNHIECIKNKTSSIISYFYRK